MSSSTRFNPLPNGDSHYRPGDSSLARIRWEGDGGACPPQSESSVRPVQPRSPSSPERPSDRVSDHPPFVREDAREPSPIGSRYELIVLPFSEYSSLVPQRLNSLRERLANACKTDAPPFVIVDTTRVARAGGMLLGLLHRAAGELRRRDRRLVLVGDLNGMCAVSRLDKLCHIATTRGEAITWCHNRTG